MTRSLSRRSLLTPAIHTICSHLAGILQPFNAAIRPHPPPKGEKRTTWRLIWEIWHKSLGLVALILAIPTMVIGTTLVSKEKEYQGAYGGAWGALVLLAIVLFVMGRGQTAGSNDKVCAHPHILLTVTHASPPPTRPTPNSRAAPL